MVEEDDVGMVSREEEEVGFDALELVIELLKEHEREINDLINRLEDVINKGGVKIAIMPPAIGGVYNQVLNLLRQHPGLNISEITRKLKKDLNWMRGYLYALKELGLVRTRRLGSAIFYYPIEEEERGE